MLTTVYENYVDSSIPKPKINSFLLLYYHFAAGYLTSCVLRNARGARRTNFASALR